MSDKSVYEFKYYDGTTEKTTANIIYENIISQVDSEGHNHQVMTEVIDHKRDDSDITKVNGFIKSINRNLHRKRMTGDYKLLVEWKYGLVDWVSLKGLKSPAHMNWLNIPWQMK